MWNALFGRVPYVSTSPMDLTKEEEPDEPPQIAYLVDGVNRLPIPLPQDDKILGDVRATRQWVFDTIARLPNEEDVETYTFKVLPDDFIYWYPMKSVAEGAYGILMKYDPTERCFKGANPNGELPQLPQSRLQPEREDIVEIDILSSNTSKKPSRKTNKRGRK